MELRVCYKCSSVCSGGSCVYRVSAGCGVQGLGGFESRSERHSVLRAWKQLSVLPAPPMLVSTAAVVFWC